MRLGAERASWPQSDDAAVRFGLPWWWEASGTGGKAPPEGDELGFELRPPLVPDHPD